jgi:hypothetical protein
MCTAGAHLNDLSAQAVREMQFISNLEGAAATRAIRFGIVLHHVKAKLEHGKFLPWINDTFGANNRQCRYYMKLALVFIESMRLNRDEVLALPEAQLELAIDQQDSSARSVLEKVAKFVGTQSLTELLIKHDIKSVGLKKELGEGAAPDDEDLSKLPLEDQIRIRRERLFGRTSEWLTHLRKSLTKPEDVQLLDKTQIETIRADIADITKALDAARAA